MTKHLLDRPPRWHAPCPKRDCKGRTSGWSRFVSGVGAAALFAMLTAPAGAAPDLIIVSPDTTLNFDSGGASGFIEDEDALISDLLGGGSELPLGNFVAAREEISVKGIHDEGDDLLLVFDEPVQLNGIVASTGDVVRFDGANSYEVIFDASAEGIPAGVEVDAVTRGKDGELVLSFNTHVHFGSFTAADEDLVRFDGVSFSMFFDGSKADVLPTLDLDAASIASNGLLYVSFDGSGTILNLSFKDEDVLEYDLEVNEWLPTLAFDSDASTIGSVDAWQLADVEALHVPEPALGGGLVVGSILLAAARYRRARDARVRWQAF